MVIRVGYSNKQNKPYFSVRPIYTGYTGIFIELFQLAAARINETLEYGFHAEGSTDSEPNATTGLYDGMLGLLQRQDIDAVIDELYFEEDRLLTFLSTLPVHNVQQTLYQGGPGEASWSVVALLVFGWKTYVVLAASIIVMQSVNFIAAALGLARRMPIFGSIRDRRSLPRLHWPSAVCAQAGALLLTTIYSGCFQGFAVNNRATTTSLMDVFEALHSKNARLAASSASRNDGTDDAIAELFNVNSWQDAVDSGRLLVTDDIDRLLNKVCGRMERYFARLDTTDFIRIHSQKRVDNCILTKIPDGSQKERALVAHQFPESFKKLYSVSQPLTLYASRRSQRFVEELNRLLLTVFSRNNMETFWLRRFAGRSRADLEGGEVKMRPGETVYEPLKIGTLKVPLLVLAGVYAFATLALLAEIAWHRHENAE